MQATAYRTVWDIEEANQRRGHHFFDEDTMRFFKSRILDGVYGGRFFVTSEKGPDNVRRYTVREAKADGSVDTYGDFQDYATAAQAKGAARRAS